VLNVNHNSYDSVIDNHPVGNSTHDAV